MLIKPKLMKKSSSVNECVSLEEHSDTPFTPAKRKISIILNLTVHSSSSERLVIIHGEIKVLMLCVK